MRNIITILFAIISYAAATAQSVVNDFNELDDCDLIFHIPSEGNNITDVTSYDGNIKADHVAVFFRIADVPLIIDATYRGVAVRNADSLIAEKGVCVYAHIKNVDKKATIKNLLSFLGRPYDYKFYADDTEIYCSELVQKSFVDSCGNFIFKTIPMSFHDSTGKVTEYWKEYYRKRWNAIVPEGEKGTNPADIYKQTLML